MAPGVTWTDNARTQLLLIIIHLGTPPKWDKVAQLLNNGCTGEAARQQFKVLKARARKEFGDIATEDDASEENMPYNWDDAGQRQLLLAVIHLTAPGPPKWDLVAKMLGDGCTSEGARKQFAKLKNSAKDSFDDAGGSEAGTEDTPKTPAKSRGKKSNGESAKKSASKRKASKPAEEANDNDDEESPVKKVKTEESKDEDDDGDGV